MAATRSRSSLAAVALLGAVCLLAGRWAFVAGPEARPPAAQQLRGA
eukprot:CAMPEP_0171202892 /NCGR_PEP_ID=MMETSP0790-20130122/25238_1 /TAXON_ID=2925 /ORGANISM="Alexandrium catenella, Strain OF101" /LENGTH=45 /DNA_ID= /DNA_START= /DNA_END= /DNA_ORIENTATION=